MAQHPNNIDFSWLGDTRHGNKSTPLLDSFAIPTVPQAPAVGIGESLSDALVSILLRLDKLKIDALASALSQVTAHLSRTDASAFTQTSSTAQLDRIEATLSGLRQDRADQLSRIEAETQRIAFSIDQLVTSQSRLESLVQVDSEAVEKLREKLAEFSKSMYQLVHNSPE